MRDKVRVETVEETFTNNKSSYTSAEEDTETSTKATPETSDNSQSTTTHNPMADAPDLDIITPSYQSLYRKNKHWGDPCKPSQVCEGPEFILTHSQNVNGISDREGILYDQTMIHMKEPEASIFAINETHGDDLNARNNSILAKSKNRIFNHKDGHYCQTVTLLSQVPVTSFTKPGGNMM